MKIEYNILIDEFYSTLYRDWLWSDWLWTGDGSHIAFPLPHKMEWKSTQDGMTYKDPPWYVMRNVYGVDYYAYEGGRKWEVVDKDKFFVFKMSYL